MPQSRQVVDASGEGGVREGDAIEVTAVAPGGHHASGILEADEGR